MLIRKEYERVSPERAGVLCTEGPVKLDERLIGIFTGVVKYMGKHQKELYSAAGAACDLYICAR